MGQRDRLDPASTGRGGQASNERSEIALLTAALGPLCEAAGLDLEQVELAPAGRRRLLRVVVDRDGGVDLDAVAEISRAISSALDSTDLMGPVPYVLEVTSPGVDRPLVRPVHWRRAIDRLVRVDTVGGRSVTARVLSCDESGVDLLADDTAAPARVPYVEISRARVQVEFSRVGAPAESEADGEEGR